MQTKSRIRDSGPNGHDAPGAAVANVLSSVSREFQDFLADIEDLVKATTSLTGEDLARARVQLGERLAAARQSAEEMGGAMASKARKAAIQTDDYVHEQPWKVIGASAAVAFLLGILVTRRS